NVGGGTVQLLHEAGCRIVGVSDVTGGIHNPEGLSPQGLFAHKEKGGALSEYEGGEPVTNEELLELECDVLITAAIEGQLTTVNAERSTPTVIVGGAHAPTTPETDYLFTVSIILA